MLIKEIRVKRVYLSASIMAGVLAGTLLNLLIIVLQQAVAPPNALTLAVGQREGDTMFIGARGVRRSGYDSIASDAQEVSNHGDMRTNKARVAA